MKGFIYNGPKNIELKEVPLPDCGENDIIVKNLYAGVCGSDITAYKEGGDFMRLYPGSEFGHEMISKVVEIGVNVKDIKVGERVFPYPMYAKDDTKRSGAVGGFSEYVHIPNCKLNHSVYKVDDSIPNNVASMLEPFGVGGQAAILSQPRAGQNAVVFGAGLIGMAAAITLKHLGCDKVMLVNRSSFRLEIAEKMGFYTCSPATQELKDAALEVFGPSYGVIGPTYNADIFIDATGNLDTFDTFQKQAKLNAVYTMVGIPHGMLTVNPQLLMFASQRIQGSGGYTPESIKTAMEIMQSGKFELAQLITQEYPLEKLEEAIVKGATTSESLKVVIKY